MATTKSKKLPLPNIQRSGSSLSSFSLGFGFDSKATDYKVVRVVMFNGGALVRAEVYSANEICWKEINVAGIKFLVSRLKCDTCLDGKLYWADTSPIFTNERNISAFEEWKCCDNIN
ncbi:hypothetical protein AgCh_026052 [Apium graveolens]